MATVPGTPMQDLTGGIPRELQPTQADMLMAAAIMHQQGRMQLAGDVIQGPFPSKEWIEGRQMMQQALEKQGLNPNPPPRPIMPLVPREK